MDEYIKKSEAVDVIVKYPYEIAGKTATAIKMIEDLPSADVVPKSEVEALQGALKAEERHNELTMKMAQKALKNARSELASEIFAEIKYLIWQYDTRPANELTEKIAELKKKYTEGTAIKRYCVFAQRRNGNEWSEWSQSDDLNVALEQVAKVRELGFLGKVTDRENKSE